MKHIRVIGMVSGLGLLAAACSPVQLATFNGTAGGDLENKGFGTANVHNMMIQTGQRDFAVDLANRFAAEVPSTVNFEFNSAVLSPEAQATLRTQADWMRQFPEVRFKVFGHTDAVGSNAYNKRLGMRRARAVVGYFVSQGIARNKLTMVVSHGETQPLIVTQGRERRNRRTVTEVSGFVKSHPLVLDGKYAQIIYRDYVASAQSQSVLTGTGSGTLTIE